MMNIRPNTRRILGTAALTMTVLFGCGGGTGTGTPNAPSTPNGGTLTLTNAPAVTNGNFTPDRVGTVAGNIDIVSTIGWSETAKNASLYGESLIATFGPSNQLSGIQFVSNTLVPTSNLMTWVCVDVCAGVTTDRGTGTMRFENTILNGTATLSDSVAPPAITLNGTLLFAPTSNGATTTTGAGDGKGNSSAVLNGAIIGSEKSAIRELRKEISVVATPGTNAADLSVGAAFATRGDTSSNYAYIALPITNNGTATRCFVKLGGLNYSDISGNVLLADQFTFVTGSVALTSSTISTNTCLAPGETGWVGDIKANLYAAVQKMEFTLSAWAGSATPPAARLVPQSYTVTPTEFTISAKNVGTRTATISGMTKWFIFDDAQQPLWWGFASYSSSRVDIAPAASTTFTSNNTYQGSSAQMRAFVNFQEAAVRAKPNVDTPERLSSADTDCPRSLAMDAYALCLNDHRTLQLQALETLSQ